MNRYYSMAVDNKARAADINIYGDITSYPWSDADVSAWNLSKQIEQLTDVDTINIYINSYGGEVAEGLAIFNALKRHKAKVITYVDGFACSIASVIFMAGDERKMANASLLMIHNAWTYAEGNAAALRKQADDLDVITEASKAAYAEHINITAVQLKHLMDNETWITPADAVNMGFATVIVEDEGKAVASQSVKNRLFAILQKENTDENSDETDENSDETDEENPDNNGEDAEKQKNAANISGFFNAILKM